jgi:hypothetical protein
MAQASTTELGSIQIETPPPHDPCRTAASPETESIAALAVQWGNAYAIADAQERRLSSLLDAAADLHWEKVAPDGVLGPNAANQNWADCADAASDSFGVPTVERAANAAWVVVEDLAQRLLAAQPTSVQEAAMKFGVLVSVVQANNYEGDTPDLLNAFLEDLTRLADAGAH